MSKIEKRIEKFYERPIPNNITFEDVETVSTHFGCIIKAGGNHMKVVYKPLGIVIPIPRHGKYVEEAYIKQLKNLFDLIQGGKS